MILANGRLGASDKINEMMMGNGKVVAPGILVISPVDKNCDSFQDKQLTFSPKYQNFGVKIALSCP